MADLLVPWALASNGEIVAPSRAVKGESYLCPNCREPLNLRAGSKRRHFAHRPGGVCNLETILHAAAKLKIKTVVENWLAGHGKPPAVQLGCEGTDLWFCGELQQLPLHRAKTDEVRLEWTLPGGLRPDLVLFKEGRPILGIEVHVTNAVSASKGARLPISWIELEAEDILSEPLRWSVLNHSLGAARNLRRCPFCQWSGKGLRAAVIQELLKAAEPLSTPRTAETIFRRTAMALIQRKGQEWRATQGRDAPWVSLWDEDYRAIAWQMRTEAAIHAKLAKDASWNRTRRTAGMTHETESNLEKT